MVDSLSEQIIALVLHFPALLNLVVFLDSCGSPWEELIFVQVHYMIVDSALPPCFVVEEFMNFLLPHPSSVFSADPYDFVVVVC